MVDPPRAGDTTVRWGNRYSVIVIQDVEQQARAMPPQTEGEVIAWRMRVLDRCGYDHAASALLAGSKDVDLHLAVDLVERGCPYETALRILL